MLCHADPFPDRALDLHAMPCVSLLAAETMLPEEARAGGRVGSEAAWRQGRYRGGQARPGRAKLRSPVGPGHSE